MSKCKPTLEIIKFSTKDKQIEVQSYKNIKSYYIQCKRNIDKNNEILI